MNTNTDMSIAGFYPQIPTTIDPYIQGQKAEKNTDREKIKSNLGKLKDAINKWGIHLSEKIQYSSREMIMNSFLTKLIRTTNSGFSKKMESFMARNWNIAISNSYEDLESNQELRNKVVEENFRYAAYMYSGLTYTINSEERPGHTRDGHEHGILLPPPGTEMPTDITLKEKTTLNSIRDNLVTMGFQSDEAGNYYHLETGSLFNFIYDKDRKEVIICFMGLFCQRLLKIDKIKMEKIERENIKGAFADWLGRVPPSAHQAVKIGEMLKETTKDTGLTPVLIGHSHGGGLAQTGAAAVGIKAVVFNSRPMGIGTRFIIDEAMLDENAKNITSFSGKGDFLTRTSILNRLGRIVNFLGIPVPRTVGKGYYLPGLPSGTSLVNIHNGFHEAMDLLRTMT